MYHFLYIIFISSMYTLHANIFSITNYNVKNLLAICTVHIMKLWSRIKHLCNLKKNSNSVPGLSGPSCSKQTMAFVKVSLKFQTLISRIPVCKYFLLKKCEKLLHFCSAKASLIFSTKNICVFGYKVVRHLMS